MCLLIKTLFVLLLQFSISILLLLLSYNYTLVEKLVLRPPKMVASAAAFGGQDCLN